MWEFFHIIRIRDDDGDPGRAEDGDPNRNDDRDSRDDSYRLDVTKMGHVSRFSSSVLCIHCNAMGVSWIYGSMMNRGYMVA